MKLELECTYCGHRWVKDFYNKHSATHERCPHCKDSNLKARDVKESKVDYYQGCPPFPEKKEKDRWNLTGIDFGFAPGVD